MRTSSFTSPVAGTVYYPHNVAFMYSRQPVIVDTGSSSALKVQVTVTCTSNGGRSHTETRYLNSGRAEFDISRIMQMLSPGPDMAMQAISYTDGAAPRAMAAVFSLKVTLGGSTVLSVTSDIQGVYGALDAGEIYGGKVTRRVFPNFPQSIIMWRSVTGVFNSTFAGATKSPTFNTGFTGYGREVALQNAISATALSRLKAGQIVNGRVSWLYRYQEGTQTQQTTRDMTLIPDNRERGDGVFLRWISRTGEAAYWLFEKQELETAAAVAETFGRHYEGDPAAPSGDVFRNPDKRNYDEARRMVLKASDVSEEEFDLLADMLSSPVVEMLMETPGYQSLGLALNGGSASTTAYEAEVTGSDAVGASIVDGGEAALAAIDYDSTVRWVRVNVDGGTQARQTARRAPRLHDFEASITLMTRNTIKL